MRVVLASRNEHKIAEVRRILAAAQVPIELLGIDDVGVEVPEIAETGATFEENALIKASAVSELTGLAAIADDSGICVDALNGMPGVLSARWSGRHRDDAANLDLVLDQTADVPDERRGAQFVCVVAFVTPNQPAIVAEGVVEGSLIRERRGEGGFGYDPIFVPTGLTQTTAELSAQAKDEVSHRGNALRLLASRLAVEEV